MSTQKWLWIGGGLLLLSALGNQQPDAPASPSGPVVAPVDAVTNAALQRLAAIATANPKAARELVPFYASAAEIIRRDTDGRVSNHEQFAKASENAHALAFKGSPNSGQLPGWTLAYDAVIKAAIGDEVTVFDAAKREKLASTLEAIAGVCDGGP